MSRSCATLLARAALDERGAAATEYVIVLSLASLGASIAIVVAGSRLLELFLFQRAILLSPIP